MKNFAKLDEEIRAIDGKLKYAKNFKEELHETYQKINAGIEQHKILVQSTVNLCGSVIPVKF